MAIAVQRRGVFIFPGGKRRQAVGLTSVSAGNCQRLCIRVTSPIAKAKISHSIHWTMNSTWIHDSFQLSTRWTVSRIQLNSLVYCENFPSLYYWRLQNPSPLSTSFLNVLLSTVFAVDYIQLRQLQKMPT